MGADLCRGSNFFLKGSIFVALKERRRERNTQHFKRRNPTGEGKSVV